ncbi:Protein of unknown function DUF2142, membrane [Coriobacterium glomerans PW2]|uniref:DUF2142 domain-containing protein n=1 Tax=Coriobacterium glomerans (strain ATCC 49209 / DSM 20642 / JCM 10262 / PW2) TaxID=700015 RepID=F2N844_CORGP|nr:DUF2142 domain-containing protein [Coriobacterium glomerans]AEB07227.1 Protein of unknown function DUF2142, membrane [Coriobacterium glomerans PW2]
MRVCETKKDPMGLLIPLVILIALIICSLYWYSVCRSVWFLVFSLPLSSAVAAFAYILATNNKVAEANWPFRTCFLLFGIIFLGLFTPGSVPDEPYHFWSSYGLATLMTGKPIDSEHDKIFVRNSDVKEDPTSSPIVSYQSVKRVISRFELFSRDSSWTQHAVPKGSLDWTSNPVFIKFFSAAGIILGWLLNLGTYPLFYMGRIFNFALFYLLACLAIRMTPVGKTGFKIICLLPITLHLASSYSYDAGIIGLAFLLIALLLRLLYGSTSEIKTALVGIPICAVLLAPCKVVYIFIVFVLFLVPSSRFQSKKFALTYKCGVLLCCVFAIAALRMATLFSMAGSSSSSVGLDYRGAESGTFYHLSDAIADPLHATGIFFRTIDQLGEFYISGTVGTTLGWFQGNIAAPGFYTFGYLLVLLLSFARSNDDDITIVAKSRFVFFAVCALSWLATMMSMYLAWTFNSEPIVMGVQGRYLLPVLPLLGLAFRSRKLRYDGSMANATLVAVTTINTLYVLRIIAIVLIS